MTAKIQASLTLCPDCLEWAWDSNKDRCQQCGIDIWNAFLNNTY